MSSLIVAHDLRMILLEIAVENLYIPWNDVFDEAIMKKTIIMFRMLDDEWTSLLPNRRDCQSYRGSNFENENFHGGRSVLFAVPETVLDEKVSGVDVQFYVYKEVSKYFELDPRQNFGFTLVGVDDLFNGIIKDLGERKELAGYMSSALEREPISRSMRGKYPLMDEDLQKTDSTIELYIRITYLGMCIINELHSPTNIRTAFYVREETDQHYPYQFRELSRKQLLSHCWGSTTILPVIHPDYLTCRCEEYERMKLRCDTGTQVEPMKRGRIKRKKRDSFLEQQLRIMRLLALLRKLKRGGVGTIGLSEKPQNVCLTPCTFVCPLSCPPCTYSPPPCVTYCPPACTPIPGCCAPAICPITCQNNL